jgi:hypothetical protein
MISFRYPHQDWSANQQYQNNDNYGLRKTGEIKNTSYPEKGIEINAAIKAQKG